MGLDERIEKETRRFDHLSRFHHGSFPNPMRSFPPLRNFGRNVLVFLTLLEQSDLTWLAIMLQGPLVTLLRLISMHVTRQKRKRSPRCELRMNLFYPVSYKKSALELFPPSSSSSCHVLSFVYYCRRR